MFYLPIPADPFANVSLPFFLIFEFALERLAVENNLKNIK